ncbi:uncharacterized protein LOC124420505 [Lucilia cuprina]|uniref:uncharacterized protein LOC124420505 n=1 Tax=Lucilia cuprina TaxID=7375 RepID=UPI001F0592AD|nr:uncharacterized protein LOC124420505 [Lucilia cuprina]
MISKNTAVLYFRLNTELESKTEDVNDSIQELQSKTDDINDFIQEDFVNLIEIDEEVDKEMYPSSSKWNPTILKEKVSSKLNTKKFNQRKTKLEDEKIKLIKIQQDFYRDENARAAEKHKLEMEKYQNEITSIRLKNELIQNEKKEKTTHLIISSNLINSLDSEAIACETSLTARPADDILSPQKSATVIKKLPLA